MWIVLLTLTTAGEECAKLSTKNRQRRLFDVKLRVDEALEKNGISAELGKRKEELMKALGDARAKRQ